MSSFEILAPVSTRRRTRKALSFSRLKELSSQLLLSWETHAFNEYLCVLGRRYPRFWKQWFSCGIAFGSILMIIYFLMCFWAIIWFCKVLTKSADVATQESNQLVTFMVPGINVPWSDLPYIVIATLVSTGFHELGHAVAATSQGVPVEFIAIFLACCLPGALVALSDQNLELLSPLSALRIYSAGIWHNGLCCAGCYLLLNFIPVILWPLYIHSINPVVLAVDPRYPLVGHLRPGDLVLEVSGQSVQNLEDWPQSLLAIHTRDLSHLNMTEIQMRKANLPHSPASQGFCIPSQFIASKVPSSSCSSDELLFYEFRCAMLDSKQGKLDGNTLENAFCLKARGVVNYPTCGWAAQNTLYACSCVQPGSCLLPVLKHGESIVTIKVRHMDGCSAESFREECQKVVIFIGDSSELIYGLHLAKYWPRSMSVFGVTKVFSWRWFPNILNKFLIYTFCISFAMAFFNSAPVFYLDGEAIIGAWLSLSRPYIHRKTRKLLLHVLLMSGSAFLGVSLLLGFLDLVLEG